MKALQPETKMTVKGARGAGEGNSILDIQPGRIALAFEIRAAANPCKSVRFGISEPPSTQPSP
jgi:hypothetical protein